MAYAKTTWKDGDLISAQKMNNVENGIESLDTQNSALSAQVGTIGQQLTTLSGKVDASETAVGNLETQVDGIEESVGSINERLGEAEGELEYATIKVDSEKDGFHTEKPLSVSFYPDSRLEEVSAKYTNTQSVIDGFIETGTYGGITRTKVGRLINLVGTGTTQLIVANTSNADVLNKVRGKSVNLCIFIKKSTPWELASYLGLYDGTKYQARARFTQGGSEYIGLTIIEDVPIAENATSLLVKFDSLKNAVFANGDCMWVGIYTSEIHDTEQIVSGDTPYVVAVSGIDCIDTLTHESTVKYVESSKLYIDNHIPDIKLYWTEEIYALPEKFGAVGDGDTDDYDALVACLNYAYANNKAVRGFGRYKISQSLVIGYRYADIYLREIIYTGNQSAIDIRDRYIRFEFHRITSANIGILFNKGSNANAYYDQVKGNEINCVGDCIVCEQNTLYNTVEIRYVRSSNGNCITFIIEGDSFKAGEYVFRDFTCACPNGYVGTNLNSSKIYNFTVESNCKYGYLDPYACSFFGCRHREQTDAMANTIKGREGYNSGALFIFTKSPITQMYNIAYVSNDYIPWFSIDVSAIQGYEDAASINEWQKLLYNGGFIQIPIGGSGVLNPGGNNSHNIIGEKLCIIGNNKVFVPEFRKQVTIAETEYDYRLFESQLPNDIKTAGNMEFATDYIIGVSHADIYFNASFGAVGYNDLTITQENGNTCTIYDKLGNVLFDGSNEGDGKWSLKCMMNRSSYGRNKISLNTWWGYDGTNEIWEIKKIE